ncbi:hypothetical protein HK101_001598 [Irineochytrium annulatum]|nr:hypothetical protein HK101_001598 [Irineochytrium annulatum]
MVAVTTSAASELAKEYPHSTSTSFDAVPTDDSPRTKLRALAAQTTPEFVGGYYDHLFSLGVKSKPLPRVDVSANLIEAEDRKGMTTMRREGRRLLAESRVDEAEVVREDVAAHFEVESDGNVDSGIFGTTGAPALEKANAAVVNAAKDLERATSDEENRVRTPNSNADGVDASATGLFLDAPITPTVPAAEPSWFHSSSMATMPLPSDELTNSSPEPTLTNDVPAFNGFPVLARTPAPALPRFATPAIASVRVDALVATGAPPSPFVSAAPSSTTILTLRTRTKTHLLRLIVPSAGWTFEDAMRAAPALNYVGMPADVLARVFVNVSEGGCAAVEGADGGSPRVEVLKGFRVGDVADVVGNREVVCCVEFERVERMQWEKV